MQKMKMKVGHAELVLETGRMAKQADGAVLASYGETIVLAAVCATKSAKPGQDFFPLTVDYREKTFAAGKIPGGFFKREAKPSDKETLTSRLIDRPIRPLFPEDYLNEVQVNVSVLSLDEENDPDVLAILATSCALQISSIPFKKPIAAVRVGFMDGQYVVNPTFKQRVTSSLDLILAASKDSVVMVEAGAAELTEEVVLNGILFGHEEIKKILAQTKDFGGSDCKNKVAVVGREIPQEVVDKVRYATAGKFIETNAIKDRNLRHEKEAQLYEHVLAQFDTECETFCEADVKFVFHECEFEQIRAQIVHDKKRPDGRAFGEIRDISCEISVLPRVHGSALFTRGQTQSLGTVTLGTKRDQQIIDALEGEYKKNFLLHYNFPAFSVGEVKPNRGPGRREIGHGALAERALREVMPDITTFPYTVRVVSDILESNGSSSMASVCSGTLALMDAGVPIKAPVAGIAMGLVTLGDKWEVLTDIAGIEDHMGDMDFKVAGTEKGITALQLDIKIDGLSEAILSKALADAHKARLHILGIMNATIANPRKEVSATAPQINLIKIDPSKIGNVIGPGGKTIRRIQEETGAEIDIDDTGEVAISAPNKTSADRATQIVKDITSNIEVGRLYDVVVKRIMEFGAICEITPVHSGMVHISEIKEGYVKTVEEHLKVGDRVKVKVLAVENEGKIRLSMKAAAQEEGVKQDA